MPDSVSKRVNREAVVVLGWGRAALLQLAHPLVAAGVSDHSGFHRGPASYVRRMRGTIGAMLSLTFGTPEEVRAALAHIDGIHGQVRGVLREAVGIFPAGTPYSARDPRLLLWVHVTIVETQLVAYELLVGPLSKSDKDAYVAEAASTAIGLGADPAKVPTDSAGIVAYLEATYASGEVRVSPAAKAMGQALLAHPFRPFQRFTYVLTCGMLPAAVRDDFGFPWNDSWERSYQRRVAFVRRLRRTLPSRLRDWPASRRHSH